MKRKIFFMSILMVSLSFMTGCGTKQMSNILVYRTPYQGEVVIKGIGEQIPSNAVLLGSVSVGETGFTATKNCTYPMVIADARRLAAGMGGNTLVITEHKEPSVYGSTCHRIRANVYFIPTK